MPVTVPMPQGFDIGPALSAHAAGLQQRTQLEDRDRERESQAQAAIIRAAELADTPEKWDRFITTIQAQFPDADLTAFRPFEARESAIAQQYDHYQRAQLDISRQELALRQSAEARAAQPSGPEPTDDMREYAFYAEQETAAGRQPVPFVEWFGLTRTPGTTVNVGQGEVGAIPQGYELFTDPQTGARSFRLIPGGPQATAAEGVRAGEITTGNIVLDNIDRALGQANWWTTGIMGQTFRGVGGTGQHDLRNTLDKIGR